LDGDVFLTSGASDEVWGTGGRDADDYDVAMTEEDGSGHYKGDFDASGNIGAGIYHVSVYLRAGANPADSDVALAQGVIEWDGSNEITLTTITGSLGQVHTTEDESPGGAGGRSDRTSGIAEGC
jgi:hypothetical protein